MSLSGVRLLKKLGDDSKAYKNIFNGMYDKIDNPICRLCLNFVVDRSCCSNRYEEVQCFLLEEKDQAIQIQLCDECAENIHEEYDRNYNNFKNMFFFAIGKKYYIDSWWRGND